MVKMQTTTRNWILSRASAAALPSIKCHTAWLQKKTVMLPQSGLRVAWCWIILLASVEWMILMCCPVLSYESLSFKGFFRSNSLVECVAVEYCSVHGLWDDR